MKRDVYKTITDAAPEVGKRIGKAVCESCKSKNLNFQWDVLATMVEGACELAVYLVNPKSLDESEDCYEDFYEEISEYGESVIFGQALSAEERDTGVIK